MSRSYAYCFTINNYTNDDCAQVILLSDIARYTLVGFEVGEQGTPHIQGYAYFTNALSRSSLSKKIDRASIRKAKGTPEQNYDYCTKDGDYWESGEIPSQGKIAREKLEEIIKNPYENFHLYNQYRKCYKELQRSEKKTHNRRMYLIDYKDRYEVASQCKDVIFIPEEKYDLYDEQQVVILDYDSTLRRPVIDWIHGFPMTIRRGYEMIKFDPEIIYIMYSTPHEYKLLRKLYYKLISN